MATVIGTGLSETIENRRNLLQNPSFETSMTGWSALSGATISRDTSEAHSGVASLKVVTPGVAGLEGAGIAVATNSAGKPVGEGIWVKAPATSKLFLIIRAGSPTNDVAVPFVGTGAWQFVTAYKPDAGDHGQPQLLVRTNGVQALTFWVDDGILEDGPVGNYFSGATAPASPYSYTWVGTPNASQSIEWVTLPIQVRPQLVDGFEASREVRNIVHPVLNKSNPDVTLRAPGLRSGEFRCLFATQADALAAFARLSVPQVFTITDPDTPAIDMAFVVGTVGGSAELSIELDDETRTVWWVVVPFVEVIV